MFVSPAKDKNDKEIFEGDIVKYGYAYDMMFTGEVVWLKDKAAFGITTSTALPFYFEPSLELEIVGNKFQNSKLLSTKSDVQ